MSGAVAVIEGRAVGMDEGRGTAAMLLFIATEALLFVSLFFGYFYLGHRAVHWPPDPPKLPMALVMLAVLLVSSAVLHWGHLALPRRGADAARAAVWTTIALGVAFIALQVGEVRERLDSVTPRESAYGSIFFAITGFHAAHLVVGLVMLAFVGLLPTLGKTAPPFKPLRNVSLYWHFVDLVWIAIVAVLYLLPRWRA
jgi:cytochrome c oxidase subunit III